MFLPALAAVDRKAPAILNTSPDPNPDPNLNPNPLTVIIFLP